MTLQDKFKKLTEPEKIVIYNNYADANHHNRIYENDDNTIDMLFHSASEFARRTEHATYLELYAYGDTFLYIFNDGVIVSFDYLNSFSGFDWSDLEKWLIAVNYDLSEREELK
jgi:hypothetical protein